MYHRLNQTRKYSQVLNVIRLCVELSDTKSIRVITMTNLREEMPVRWCYTLYLASSHNKSCCSHTEHAHI